VRQDEAAPEPFDLCGELPSGTTVLEASAGTGKTYAIAALAARYIAEGIAELGQLMLVTFGRMATNELRLRVRERLVSLEARLATLEPPAGSRIQPLGQRSRAVVSGTRELRSARAGRGGPR
jgi:exodeoxyribonuclease V beta subunit